MAWLWKPAVQWNLRNQWSRLLSNKRRWEAAAAEGRSSGTMLVNAHLSCRYIPDMNLGVLKDMPEIRQKACEKLALKQFTMKTKAVDIWGCKDCGKVKVGDAYTLNTASAVTVRSAICRLREQVEGRTNIFTFCFGKDGERG